MSQSSRKYKRIEALFSDVKPVAPVSPSRAGVNPPSVMAPAEDRKERVEVSRAPQSAEDPRPAVIISPTVASSAGSRHEFLGDIERGPTMGFSYDQGKITSLKDSHLPPPENALMVPLVVSGSTIGIVQVAAKQAGMSAQEIEIVSAVAMQLARHLKKLLLVEQNKKNAQRK
jgi:hypothetical protein